MVKTETAFLIDSNSLITPYKQYYAFDLVPSFWDKLREAFKTERIIVLDIVWNELEKGGDEDQLFSWLKDNRSSVSICSHKNENIINNYAKVINYLQASGLYLRSAMNEWASNDKADPWLIATAMSFNYVVVSEEGKSGGLSKKQKNKQAKIPDVAEAMGVRVIPLFEMMREMKIVI